MSNYNFRLGKCFFFLTAALLLFAGAFAQQFPTAPDPPRLVNDFAHTMDAAQQQKLEQKLEDFDRTTSTQITIVTVKTLGGYEIADYAVTLANKWGIGRKGKDNGVLLLAAIEDRKVNISTGYGLEGALPDIITGRIIRNEIAPAFREGNYYQGFEKATDAIIAATKGEYKADTNDQKKDISTGGIIGLMLLIYLVVWFLSKIGGGGGGNYMSGRGYRRWGGGYWGGGGGWGGGSGSSGGGGFGGFGGGSFGGGGSSGSW